jgi:hypothetical protein
MVNELPEVIVQVKLEAEAKFNKNLVGEVADAETIVLKFVYVSPSESVPLSKNVPYNFVLDSVSHLDPSYPTAHAHEPSLQLPPFAHTTSLQASGLQDEKTTEANVPIVSNEANKIDFKFFILIIFCLLQNSLKKFSMPNLFSDLTSSLHSTIF